MWNGSGKNPYYALLAQASAIVTTPDSISMTTEAIASQKPVFMLNADQCKVTSWLSMMMNSLIDLAFSTYMLPVWPQGKFQRFHQALNQANFTRPFTRQAAQELLATPSSTSGVPAPCTAIEEELDAIIASIAKDIRALCAEPALK